MVVLLVMTMFCLIFQVLIVGAVSSETDLIFSLLAGDAKLFTFTRLTLNSSSIFSHIHGHLNYNMENKKPKLCVKHVLTVRE